MDIMGNRELFESFKDKIKSKVSQLSYTTWLSQIEKGYLKENKFILVVPNKFVADWITDFYKDTIINIISELTDQPIDLAFEIREITTDACVAVELKNDAPPVVNKTQNITVSGLNKKFSFDTFVVGDSNQFAHAAGRAISDLPGGKYNPLFIYGGVGLGKTHLINAIGIEIKTKYPDLTVVYTTGERFMNDLICSLRFERMMEFRKKYRDKCHVLLIDDIQFLAGKEKTQDEFFHTFDVLHESQRQIVMTSDRFPKEIPGIEERLRSRFEWGLIADIAPPDLETRIAILQKKAGEERLACPLDVAIFLASNIKTNIRELEGSLIRLNAFATLTNAKITVDFAKEVLKSFLPIKEISITIEDIQKKVSEFYSITTTDLKSTSRIKSLSYPRQIAMFLCKKHLKSSFPEIGGMFGGKDHTTVLHACRKIEKLLECDKELQTDITSIEKNLLQ